MKEKDERRTQMGMDSSKRLIFFIYILENGSPGMGLLPNPECTCIRRSLSTATHFSLQKVNFESASKVVPNDCNDMFWCISITNNVKSCKKFSEKAQTGKITVFTMVNQHCGAENMEK